MKTFMDITKAGHANLRVFLSRELVEHPICADVGKGFVRKYRTLADGSTFIDATTNKAAEDFVQGAIIILEPDEDLPAPSRHEKKPDTPDTTPITGAPADGENKDEDAIDIPDLEEMTKAEIITWAGEFLNPVPEFPEDVSHTTKTDMIEAVTQAIDEQYTYTE